MVTTILYLDNLSNDNCFVTRDYSCGVLMSENVIREMPSTETQEISFVLFPAPSHMV